MMLFAVVSASIRSLPDFGTTADDIDSLNARPNTDTRHRRPKIPVGIGAFSDD
jgi:hypothetical protein